MSNFDLHNRSRSLTKPARSIPVTHPSLVSAAHGRYILGMARTETGALRILRKAPVPQTFKKARQRLLNVSGKTYAVWEPA